MNFIQPIFPLLERAVTQWKPPIVSELVRVKRDPYIVLVSCLLSLRTKDEVTEQASRRLFAMADTPAKMVALSTQAIEHAIYPVGFYRTKARNLIEISRTLIAQYHGIVPADLDTLLTLKGVGRKTANLVVTMGYGQPGICVDTHVHRITNRWGYVRTKTPDATEIALREKLPPQYWLRINDLLVTYGQNLCKPISPWCSRCSISEYCAKIGVSQSR